ncbi:hypothetical protein GCM10027162_61800 [Streptomyces incanus]
MSDPYGAPPHTRERRRIGRKGGPGLEVIDRVPCHRRIAAGYGPAPATPVGVHPF